MLNRSVCSLILFTIIRCLRLQNQQSQLIFVQLIIRHGHRYPLVTQFISSAIQSIPQYQKGELTQKGSKITYALGQQMFQVYWEKLFNDTEHLLNFTNRIYSRSSKSPRTLQSGQSFMLGFLENLKPLELSQDDVQSIEIPYKGHNKVKAGYIFGEGNKFFHPFPIYHWDNQINSTSGGDFLNRLGDACQNNKKWQLENFSIQKYQSMLADKRVINILNNFNRQLNISATLSDYNDYYDYLLCSKSLGQSTSQYFNSNSQENKSLYLLNKFTTAIRFEGNQDQNLVFSTGLLEETIKNIKNAIDNPKDSKKLIFYFTHDIIMISVLKLMGKVSIQCIYEQIIGNDIGQDCTNFPMFAGNIAFEVYKSNGVYSFKMNYNGKHIKIPFCNKKTCLVQDLYKWFNSLKKVDVKQACGVN